MSTTTPRLGIDLDSTCFDFGPCFNDFLVEAFGVFAVECDRWDWWQQYGIPGDECWPRFWQEGSRWLLEGAPLPGAVDALNILAQLGHELHFITYRPSYVEEVSTNWLVLQGIPYSTVNCVDDKSEIPCDFYLDDFGPTVAQLRERGLNAWLFNQPWNADFDLPRLMNWADVLEELVNDDGLARTW